VTPEDVRRIAAIRSPVPRNLQITQAYAELAAAMPVTGANWCTFATWASRQAGRTIRGEDAIGRLQDCLGRSRSLLHPLASFGRWLLRRGLFDPQSRLGRLTARLHTPFDAVEAASAAVARGNLKVFEEIAYVFACYLEGRPLELSDSQELLRSAFADYDAARVEGDPAARAQLLFAANLKIGLHEQTRLQPEIGEALDAASVPIAELGRRLCPGRARPVQLVAGTLAAPVQRSFTAISRELITESLMTLALPGRVLALGTHLPDEYPSELRELTVAAELVARFEPAEGEVDDCGARDWSDLDQRMHYIVHLFRAFHVRAATFGPPFTNDQVALIRSGKIPDGDL
jgi:hypothetical protein